MSVAAVMNQAVEDHPAPPPPKRELTPQGRLREQAEDVDRTLSALSHLWLFAFVVPVVGMLCVLVPLVLWAVRRERSPFSDDHGREVMNAQISLVVVTLLSVVTLIGPLIVVPVFLVNMIRGALAAGRGEYFRYPLTIRFIS
jgi:uncharacterized protein